MVLSFKHFGNLSWRCWWKNFRDHGKFFLGYVSTGSSMSFRDDYRKDSQVSGWQINRVFGCEADGGWIELTCHLRRTYPSENKQIDIRVWIKWVYFMVCQTQKRVAFTSKMSSRHKQQDRIAPILISPWYFWRCPFSEAGTPSSFVLDSMLNSNTNGFTSWMSMDGGVTFHFPMKTKSNESWGENSVPLRGGFMLVGQNFAGQHI